MTNMRLAPNMRHGLPLVCALLIACTAYAQTPVSFFQPVSLGFCLYVAAADFNGDGNLDVACAGTDLTIWLGDGKGHFQQSRQTLPYYQPQVVAGDFNGDGFQDLVVAGSGQLLLLPGHGDGTFGPQTTIADVQVNALAAGDLGNDGRLDLLVAVPSSYPNGMVEVFLNNGNGTFESPTTTGVIVNSFNYQNIAVADFNGDGVLDLVSMYFTTGGDGSAAIEVALGNGDGTFGTPIQTLTGTDVGPFAVADFAGSGNLGVAFTSAYKTGPAIFVFNGNGDGSFSPGPITSVQSGNVTLAADLNGDGQPDLVLNNPQVGVVMNEGGGAFGREMWYQGQIGYSGAAANFRHSSPPDLMIGGDFYPNDGLGHFHVPQAYQVASECYFCGYLVTGDFNGDGNLDAAVILGAVSVFDGNGRGGFNALQTTSYHFPDREGLTVGAAADFNNDGKLDLVLGAGSTVTGKGEVVVVLGNGDGTFGPPTVAYSGYRVYTLVTADFNNDGNTDIAVGTYDGVGVLLADGTGGFVPSAKLTGIANSTSIVVADFNGDGIPDLATASDVFLGNGDGTFRHSYTFPEAGDIIQTGDFTGDGIPDLVALSGPNGMSSILLWPGKGDGTFGLPTTIASSVTGGILAADLNGDGNLDIVNAGVSTVTLGLAPYNIYLGLGNGTFTKQTIDNLPAAALFPVAGNFQNGGLPDILLLTSSPLSEDTQLMTLINTNK